MVYCHMWIRSVDSVMNESFALLYNAIYARFHGRNELKACVDNSMQAEEVKLMNMFLLETILYACYSSMDSGDEIRVDNAVMLLF